MGLFGDIFKGFLSDSSSQQRQKRGYEPPRRYTPEEYIIYEQEKSGKTWNGVSLSELSKLAQTIYRGKHVTVDKYNFLVFHYTSNSRKTNFSVQCKLNENGQLIRMLYGYYPGQGHDSADEFIEKANQKFFR